jgi:coenzyme F420-dependent glucose-6-phosphate dehydrogenase
VLTLGYKASTEQFAPDQLLEWVVEAEAQGFDAVTASDHFHPWRDDVHCFSVWPWFGAVGMRTRRIRFGPGVTCPTLRLHPAVVAQDAATLAAMFPGRFWLGLGTGEALNERAATGRWPDYPERRAMLAEAVEIIRHLWAGEHLTYRGRYFQTRAAHLYVRPAVPIPLIIGAAGVSSVRLAGQRGDGWMIPGSEGGLEELQRTLIPVFEGAARAAGRDPAALGRAVEVKVICTDDPSAALAEARLWASSLLPEREKYGLYDPRDMQRYGALLSDETIRRHWLISADPEDHIALAEQYLRLGFDQLYFHTPGPRQGEFLQFYGAHVLPRLRQRHGTAHRAAV